MPLHEYFLKPAGHSLTCDIDIGLFW